MSVRRPRLAPYASPRSKRRASRTAACVSRLHRTADERTTIMTASRWLRSTEWLASQLGKPDLVVVDGSFYLPAQNRNASEEYLAQHIPGAIFFDLDAVDAP